MLLKISIISLEPGGNSEFIMAMFKYFSTLTQIVYFPVLFEKMLKPNGEGLEWIFDIISNSTGGGEILFELWEEGKKKVIEVSEIFDATCGHATKIIFFSS